MTTPTMNINIIGIDCQTGHARRLLTRLSKLGSVHDAEYMGKYHMDPNFCQVHVHTTLSEEEVDDWLYRLSSTIQTYGTFTVEPAQALTMQVTHAP